MNTKYISSFIFTTVLPLVTFVDCSKSNIYFFILEGAWVDAEGSEMKWAVNGKKQAWHHPPCFVDRRTELDIDLDITADMLNV